MVSPHEPRPLVAKGAAPSQGSAALRMLPAGSPRQSQRLSSRGSSPRSSTGAPSALPATASLTTPRYRSRAVCRTRASTASGTSAVSRCLSLRSEACARMVPEWYRLGTTSRRVLRSSGVRLATICPPSERKCPAEATAGRFPAAYQDLEPTVTAKVADGVVTIVAHQESRGGSEWRVSPPCRARTMRKAGHRGRRAELSIKQVYLTRRTRRPSRAR